ncbi:hypothetical protein C8J57DRAFT_221876, partial [Mycena rebaudengoi]
MSAMREEEEQAEAQLSRCHHARLRGLVPPVFFYVFSPFHSIPFPPFPIRVRVSHPVSFALPYLLFPSSTPLALVLLLPRPSCSSFLHLHVSTISHFPLLIPHPSSLSPHPRSPVSLSALPPPL